MTCVFFLFRFIVFSEFYLCHPGEKGEENGLLLRIRNNVKQYWPQLYMSSGYDSEIKRVTKGVEEGRWAWCRSFMWFANRVGGLQDLR